MKRNGPHDLHAVLRSLKGLRCWYVSCGGCTIPTFQLALGKKVLRTVPLRNPAQSKEYRKYMGEASLLVWCSWRLDGLAHPLTSSDDAPNSIEDGLAHLVGLRINSAILTPPSWDLAIHFSHDLALRVFCDHVPGDPSFDGNWDLFLPSQTVSVGPGASYSIEKKTSDGAGEKITPGKSHSRRLSG